MSEATSRIAAFLQLSDKFLARAEREDLEECARILAVQCAHYQSKFCKLPISDTLEVLSSETMNDEQATWLGNGMEMVSAFWDGWSRRSQSTRPVEHERYYDCIHGQTSSGQPRYSRLNFGLVINPKVACAGTDDS